MTIRAAQLRDMAAVHALVCELATYEKEPEAVITTIADYERDYAAGVFKVLIAQNEAQEVVGMMLYYIAYSTWKGKMLYLDDFVVRDSERGKGIGQLLWAALENEARALGVSLLKWQVLDWNTPALRFYDQVGATIEKGWWNGKKTL